MYGKILCLDLACRFDVGNIGNLHDICDVYA